MLSPGQILDGRYEILSLIASGNMGSVYRARRVLLLDEVAIKVIRVDDAMPAVRDRFVRESRAAAGLHHPNIVGILDFDLDSTRAPFLVMELLNGPSVKDEISSRGWLDIDDIRRIVPPLCSALHLAHGNGIIHRDLKPANIVRHDFAGGERVYKIVDFGIPWPRLQPLLVQLVEAARALHRRHGLLCGLTPDMIRIARATGDEEERLMISTAGIWQGQDLLATLQEQTLRGLGLADDELRYVAPELLTGQAADVRSDVFTMGVLGYEMATGTLPYDSVSMPALLGTMLRGKPVDPQEQQPTLPASAAAALLRALRPAPDDRFASAKELAAALFG